MKTLLVLLFLWNVSSPVKHSVKYFHTGYSGIPNFPEFVSVGLVDDILSGSCDSNTRRASPKHMWANKITEADPQYWEWNSRDCVLAMLWFQNIIESLKQRFNQTGDVHVYQIMYGCEWDDETEQVHGYKQHGYDGEDFIMFDLGTETWISPTSQGIITKNEWDRDRFLNEYWKNYLTKECIEWLKKYLHYGSSVLLRKELPSVSLLQKSPDSPVSCHATGFYPKEAMIFWRKNGEELHEDVDLGEILPNHDGTFQMSIDLSPSAIPLEDWRKYECVFHLSGAKEDIITRLDKAAIRTNWDNPSNFLGPVIGGVSVLLLVIIGLFIWRSKCSPTKQRLYSAPDDTDQPAEQPRDQHTPS